MFKVAKYPHGTFSWVELVSQDAQTSKEFLTGLFGWSPVDNHLSESMIYTQYELEDELIAASLQMRPEMIEIGMPSGWYHYITVEDVDALVDRVKELGGQVMAGPFEAFGYGRLITIADPLGASVNLWQPRSRIGAGLVNRPGAMAWNELATPDSEAAQAFYGALLGWEFTPEGPPGHTLIRNRGRANGGILQMTDEWKDADGNFAPSHWTVYFSVADIDQAVEKVRALGGEARYDTMTAAGVGRFRIIRDPAGAVSTLIQLDQPEPWTE